MSTDIDVLNYYTKGKSIIRGSFPVSSNDQSVCSSNSSQNLTERAFIGETPTETVSIPSPCIGYFSGFQNPNNKYAYVYCYDWDVCLFSSGIDESPIGGPSWVVDGHFALKAIAPNRGVVIESTGGYAGSYPVGNVYNISDIVNLGNYPVVVSDSYAHGYGNQGCGNPDGSWIRAELFGLGGNCIQCDCGNYNSTAPTCTNSRKTLTYGYIDTLYKSSEIKISCPDGSYRTCFNPCQVYGYYWTETRSSTVYNTLISQQYFVNPLPVSAKLTITGGADDILVLDGSNTTLPKTIIIPPYGVTTIGYIDTYCCTTSISVTLNYSPLI
jgi:hypothetical protein